MYNNSDSWITVYNYGGASFYFRRIKKHYCPVCRERLRESYTNSVSWDESVRAKQLAKKYTSAFHVRANVDERFYCFYCQSCKEYYTFRDIKLLEETAKAEAFREKMKKQGTTDK